MIKRLIKRSVNALPHDVQKKIHVLSGSILNTYNNRIIQSSAYIGGIYNDIPPLRSLFVGNIPQYKLWLEKLYPNTAPQEKLQQTKVKDLYKSKSYESKFDFIILPVNPHNEKYFINHGWFLIPKFIPCIIDLHTPLNELFKSNSVRDDIRIIKKQNFTFSTVEDHKSLEYFYHKMLLPSMMHRHKDKAYLSEIEHLKAILNQGHLLQVHLDGDWVGGGLMDSSDPDELAWMNSGWLHGDDIYRTKKVVSALIQEMIHDAIKQKYHRLNLGSCNPFTSDGSLAFKLKWGAKPILPTIHYHNHNIEGLHDYMACYLNIRHPLIQQFIHHHPIFIRHKKGVAIINWDTKATKPFKRLLSDSFIWKDLKS